MASSKVRSESRTDLVPDVDISPKDSEVVNAGHQPSYESQSYDTQSFGSQSLSTPRCLDVYPSLEMTSDRPTSHMFAAVLTCLALNIVFGPPALLCASKCFNGTNGLDVPQIRMSIFKNQLQYTLSKVWY